MVPRTLPFRIIAVQFLLPLPFATILPAYPGDAHKIALSPIKVPPIQCELFTFSWEGGTPPFFVNLYLNGQGDLERSLGPVGIPSLMWNPVDFPSKTQLRGNISDSSHSESELSDPFTVQAGSFSKCLGGSSTTPSTTSNTATSSTDLGTSSTSPSENFPTSSAFISTTISQVISLSPAPVSLTLSPSPTLSGAGITSILTPLGSQSFATTSSYEETRTTPTISNSSGTPGTDSPPLLQMPTSLNASSTSIPSHSNISSTFKPSASTSPQQSALSQSGKGGRIAGIIIGCLAAAVLAALALALLQKRRRAKERSRIASMTTLDTLAFTATTWSDLSPPEPDKDKPLGANKGVTEWNADRFARDRDSPAAARKQQNARSPPSPSPWIPFTMSMPQAPFRRAPRITSLSTIPEASGTETTMPSPVESDDSASTAPSLHSYPPLVPQTLSAGFEDRAPRQHAYYPPMAPPSAQVPANPFRARLLAAAGNGSGAWGGDLSRDPFR